MSLDFSENISPKGVFCEAKRAYIFMCFPLIYLESTNVNIYEELIKIKVNKELAIIPLKCNYTYDYQRDQAYIYMTNFSILLPYIFVMHKDISTPILLQRNESWSVNYIFHGHALPAIFYQHSST